VPRDDSHEPAPADDSREPAPADDSHEPASADTGDVEELDTILERFEQLASPLAALFAELRRVALRLPTRRRARMLHALRDIDRQTRKHGADTPETAHGLLEVLRRVVASQSSPAQSLQRVLEALEQAVAASLPAEAIREAQRLLRGATSKAMPEPRAK